MGTITKSPLYRSILILLLLAAFVVVALLVALGRIVDWLWLGEFGYRQVFWQMLALRFALFTAALLPLSLYFWLNVRAALHTITSWQLPNISLYLPGRLTPGSLVALGIIGPIVGALLLATYMAGSWDALLRFWYGGAFDIADPILGRDIGFYVLKLPLIDTVHSVLTVAALLGLALQLTVYHGLGAFGNWRSLETQTRARAVRLIGLNAAFVVGTWSVSYVLERFHLFYTSGGTVIGPGYTDVHVVMPALWFMTGASVLLIAAIILAVRGGRVWLIATGVPAFGVLHIFALWIVPALVQGFIVSPSELERERPFLKHNIAFTRLAFALDSFVERDYPGATDLGLAAIQRNQQTVRNIRLWSYGPLLRTFRQIQQIRLYYQFNDMDVDRYQLADGYRQVMVSARELAPELPKRADTWLNRRLQYTHGYGLAMSLAAQEGGQGTPSLIIKDLPPVAERVLEITQPAIYYGDEMEGYRIVASGIGELDYPKGDRNVYVSYDGKGGVPIGSFWSRLLFSIYMRDLNLLLTEYIIEKSRIQFRRRVQDRIDGIAPFLHLDRDPYVVTADGALYWIQDAYTTSDRYPYSESYGLRPKLSSDPAGLGFAEPVNYMRNSVKIVIDAYHGSPSFYVMDPDDPILRSYRKAFPVLFKPLEAMPAVLRQHLRYPLDLFEAQIDRYNTYHMQDPQVLYNNEDLWSVSREKYAGSPRMVDPYYILMRLPGEERLQFMLMMPLTPNKRDNLIAWIAVKNDFPGYGEFVVFKLPKERLIYGPMQIEALIDQDTAISRQLSLWDQRGSKVIRGNLLVVPIEHSLLYVEPVYLVAEENDVPQLKRVITAHGDKVAMAPTLDESLSILFGEATPRMVVPSEGETASRAAERSRAKELLQRAEKAASQGDWQSFGSAMDALKEAIEAQSAPK